MEVYSYDPDTYEYRGTAIAYTSPREEGKVLMPAHSTTVKPPETTLTPVWNGSGWTPTEDHRGERYWLSTDTYDSEPKRMTALGPLPTGAVTTRPEKSAEVKAKEALQSERSTLLSWLQEHDYIGVKIATGRATADEYAAEIATMTEYAARINEIDKELA